MNTQEPLLQLPQSTPNYSALRPVRKSDKQVLPHSWFNVIALHLSGRSPKEVQAATGYSQAMYYRILSDPRSVSVRAQLLSNVEKDFEALYARVVNNIRDQLDSEDQNIQQRAQEQWLKAHGKFQPKPKQTGEELSAEELVSKLLNQQINVTVNLGGQAEGPVRCAGEVVDASI